MNYTQHPLIEAAFGKQCNSLLGAVRLLSWRQQNKMQQVVDIEQALVEYAVNVEVTVHHLDRLLLLRFRDTHHIPINFC